MFKEELWEIRNKYSLEISSHFVWISFFFFPFKRKQEEIGKRRMIRLQVELIPRLKENQGLKPKNKSTITKGVYTHITRKSQRLAAL